MLRAVSTLRCSLAPGGRGANADGAITDCQIATAENQLPLTQGRELLSSRQWNTWVDSSLTRVRDQRSNLDNRSNAGSIAFGLDSLVNPELVAGVQMSVSRSLSDSFEGDLRADTTGVMIGPYLSYRMSPAWNVYGSLGIGQMSTDTQLLGLNGTSKAYQYNLNLQAEGQYAMGEAFARPTIQLSHTYTADSTGSLSGTILNRTVAINTGNKGFNVGSIQPSVEFNRTFDIGDNRTVMPYVELGVNYQYARANAGQILTGYATYASTSPWAGLVHVGGRSHVGKATMVKFDVGYQSVGVKDLST